MKNCITCMFKCPMRIAFDKFHAANPEVWEDFQKYAFRLIKRGHKRHSADCICHKIRFDNDVRVMSDDGFKINNNHVTFYARKFANKHPEYKTFFVLKKLHCEKIKP